MIKCLIIEDYRDDVDLILRLFRKADLQLDYQVVENEVKLREALEEQDWDIILSDYTLPDLDGFLILDILAETQKDIPIIFVSGTIDNSQAVRLMKNGAKDYILKNELTRLPPAVERELKESEIRKKEKLSRQKIIENESRLNVIFNNMNKGVIVLVHNALTDKWVIKEINPIAKKIAKDLSIVTEDESSINDCNEMSAVVGYDLKQLLKEDLNINRILHKKNDDEIVGWIQYNASKLPNGDILMFFNDITDTKRYQKEIESRLDEKELMLHEIHHRVRNTLQIIQSFIKMKSNSISEEKYLRKFIEIRDQVRSMSLVYDRLYKSENLVYIDIKDYLESLAKMMLKDWEKEKLIQLKTDIEPIKMDVEKVIPLALLTNELLTNSMKHAFDYNDDKTKTIELSVKVLDNSEVNFSYKDNGVGYKESEIDKSSKHFGAEMIFLLASKQLRGKIDLITKAGFGFSVTFNPKPNETKGRFRPGL